MHRSRQRGFTLLEMLLVVVLLGVIAAFAWPDFSSSKQAAHLEESARRLRSVISMCRAEAMNEARRYRVEVRLDGSIRMSRQLDPLKAPHIQVRVGAGWARLAKLQPDVWVEAVQVLPEGPPPILIVDEELRFPEMEIEPILVAELEEPVAIEFAPDGSTNSLRLILRDERGNAALVTLDGRLGRVKIESWPSVPADDVQRPEPIDAEEDELPDASEFDLEDFEEYRR